MRLGQTDQNIMLLGDLNGLKADFKISFQQVIPNFY